MVSRTGGSSGIGLSGARDGSDESYDSRRSSQRISAQRAGKDAQRASRLAPIKRKSVSRTTGRQAPDSRAPGDSRSAKGGSSAFKPSARRKDSHRESSAKPRNAQLRTSSFHHSALKNNRQLGLRSKTESFNTGRPASATSRRIRRDTRPITSAKNVDILPKLVISLVILLIVGVAVYFTLRISGTFAIQNVNIEGAKYTTSSELTKSSSIPVGSTLLDLNAGKIESNLEANPWVENAKVELQFPDTLNLVITEKDMAARVIVMDTEGGTHDWVLGEDLMWLTELPGPSSPANLSVSRAIYDDIESILLIEDVPMGVAPVAGSYCSDETILNALDIVNGLTTHLAGEVVSVKAEFASDAIVMLESGVEVCFGSPKGTQDIREKERVVIKLLEENPDEITYINVAIPSKPTWRSV